jgi:Cro/C1-type HTH DNA-binding domain
MPNCCRLTGPTSLSHLANHRTRYALSPATAARGTGVTTAAAITKAFGYRWYLRRLMAKAGMFATADLGPPLAERGITSSWEQVYRLVTGIPERLSQATSGGAVQHLGLPTRRSHRARRF